MIHATVDRRRKKERKNMKTNSQLRSRDFKQATTIENCIDKNVWCICHTFLSFTLLNDHLFADQRNTICQFTRNKIIYWI